MEISGNTKKVVDYLIQSIISGERPFGSMVSEMEVAEVLGISRSPIREAIKILNTEGVLKHYPNRGTMVADVTSDDINEIYDLREAFELMSVERACKYMEPGQLASIRKGIEGLNEKSSLEEYNSVNFGLHSAIVHCSGNKRLIKFYDTLNLQISLISSMPPNMPDYYKDSICTHLAIVEALELRDADLVKERLKAHLEESRLHTLSRHR